MHGLRVIADCAQANCATYKGSRVGSFGDAARSGFYPTRNLGAIGDGGAVMTDDFATADRVRALREYGRKELYVSQTPGWNSRLGEMQAAILRVKLHYLDVGNQARMFVARKYDAALRDSGSSCQVSGKRLDMSITFTSCDVRNAIVCRHPSGKKVSLPLSITRSLFISSRLTGAACGAVT